MRFCPWYPLASGAVEAPASPGVFQVRVAEGLLDYPRGKSAMIHYEVAPDVRDAVIAFAARFPGQGWLCRHTIEMSAKDVEDVEALHAKLIGDFRSRFGSDPRLPP
jgi:hypothetical protein